MTAADGTPEGDDEIEVDEDTPAIRQFLENIVRRGQGDDAESAVPEPGANREHQVSRFAWSCEELNVAFGGIDATDGDTLRLLADHGVALTLAEVQTKAAALVQAIDAAEPGSHPDPAA